MCDHNRKDKKLLDVFSGYSEIVEVRKAIGMTINCVLFFCVSFCVKLLYKRRLCSSSICIV